MRVARIAILAAVAVLALGASACGSDELVAPEVPGEPVAVPIPTSQDSLGDNAASGDATATPTPTPDASGAVPPEDQSGATAPATGTDTGAATGTDGAAAAPQEDSATSDSPPPAGSDAEKFEDFCAQNPGAC